MKKYYAHSLEGEPPEKWQPLDNHLENVAELATAFAKPFGGEIWAGIAGLWHDLGKYSNEFQKKLYDANGIECHLETKPGKVIHSQAGGHLAQQKMSGGMERIFCWLIMGHHAGLADFGTDRTGAKALKLKMQNPEKSNLTLKNVPDRIKNQPVPEFPELLKNGADLSFFIRMLFSCVVDADFLDTEAFMNLKKAATRNKQYPTMDELLSNFEKHMDQFCQKAEPTEVNEIRMAVLEQCRQAAKRDPAVFSLTVPTGGGKTLSSMAFALRHTVQQEKERIIYVIPYTSIIEQTVKVFRNILGFENAVLEHHCNVANDDESKESIWSRLVSENWDAPIVVTTAVQFFESLYACKTSRCRKLHNIANSVIIFDEAQCLPPGYLRSVTFAIRELFRHYRVTPVLCTATQPVLTQTEQFDFKFKEGFGSVKEIVENPRSLTKNLQRVKVEVYNKLQPVGYDELSKQITLENQSTLCIVNRKKDCRTLARSLPEEKTFHLSTNMCAVHRLRVLEKIRKRLKSQDELFYVISTSLVEAGVDLDFPVVYRALAGLDSIAQAAGRCNREGKLPTLGKTVVFVPEKQPDYVQGAATLALEYLDEGKLGTLFLPDTFERYFKQRFFQLGENTLDKKNIRGLLPQHLDKIYFRTAAEKFNLIDDEWQFPLIVPYGKGPELVVRLIDEPWAARKIFRKLQPYIINISQKMMYQLINEHYARELSEYPGSHCLGDKGLYSDRFGFVPPEEIDCYDPGTYIV